MLPLLASLLFAVQGEDWTQLKFDGRHSGNAADRDVTTPLGLLAAVPLGDAVLASPVVADGTIYVVDGSGTLFAIDPETFRVAWKKDAPGGKENCNNVSSPVVAGDYVHFGLMDGTYCIVNRKTQAVR